MKKKWWFLIIGLIFFAGVFVFSSVSVQNFIWSFRSFINPNIREQLEDSWKNKSSNFLLRKMKSNNYAYSGTAISILVERGEKRAVPIFLKQIKSKDDQTRLSAFIALSELKDPRAIEPLMAVVKQGEGHEDYLDALEALSALHYDLIYPQVLELVKSNSENAYVVDMLFNFSDKPDILPALKNIAETDPERYVREKAKKAIEKLDLKSIDKAK